MHEAPMSTIINIPSLFYQKICTNYSCQNNPSMGT